MVQDIKEYIKNCQNCQQQENFFIKISRKLQSIPIPSEVMKQIRVDRCKLLEPDGYIDYFSK